MSAKYFKHNKVTETINTNVCIIGNMFEKLQQN